MLGFEEVIPNSLDAVSDRECLGLGPVTVDGHLPIGQHAVDIQQQELYLFCTGLRHGRIVASRIREVRTMRYG